MKVEEIFAALAMLEQEKGIPQSYMMDKIVQALVNAYKHDHPEEENVIVRVNEEGKTLKMYVQKKVVDVVENPGTEISRADAKGVAGSIGIGETVSLPVDNVEFGRIAAGNGKQIIVQGLKEAERDLVYNQFASKEHEILTGVVTRIDPRNGNAMLRIGAGREATDALLSANEQIPGEVLTEGMRCRVYMVEVRRGMRGPQVVVSRTHPGLVKRLFELESPEIHDGIVEVKNLVREAGSRAKMAVLSHDPSIDAIGACVGSKSQRVEAVVHALNGEKIDILKYSSDPAEYIAAALAPADVISITLNDDGKSCHVIVPDDQLSLAIGRDGQNARLAARLTGYKIDIKPESRKDEIQKTVTLGDIVKIVSDEDAPAAE